MLMECNEVRERLLDLLEGALSVQDRQLVEEHLASCAECRTEMARLKDGMSGLERYVDYVKQTRVRRSNEAFRRLLNAMEMGRKRADIVTRSRIVVAAALAAIAVSGYLIYQDLRLMRAVRAATSIEAVPPVVVEGSNERRVVLMPAVDDRWQDAIPRYMQVSASSDAAKPATACATVFATSPGAYVPVRNHFYDPEEAAYWW
jgi:anti-sigma factor RsiW